MITNQDLRSYDKLKNVAEDVIDSLNKFELGDKPFTWNQSGSEEVIEKRRKDLLRLAKLQHNREYLLQELSRTFRFYVEKDWRDDEIVIKIKHGETHVEINSKSIPYEDPDKWWKEQSMKGYNSKY